MSDDDVVEALARELFERFGREVAASLGPVPPGSSEYLWTVMVEGDAGAVSGRTLADALRHRLASPAPEFDTGWGSDAK